MDDLPSIRRSLQVLVLIALFVTAYFARDLILPIVLGFLLALTLSPVSRGLYRAGVPHAASGFVLISATAVLILGIIGGSAGTVALWSDEIPKMGVEIQQKLRGMSDAVEEVRAATAEVEKIGKEGNGAETQEVQEVVVKAPTLLSSAFDTATQFGATLAVTLILALFLLSSGQLFYLKLVQAMPTMAEKKRALSTVYDVERRVSRYLLTITIINAGLGFAIGLYLAALGLPNAYIWGIAAFLLNFLPYLGGFIGAVLVGAFSIVTFDSLGYALLAPLGYQILTGIEGQLITPWLVGRRLRLNTVAVFLTVVFWGWLWGIPGALVAVPFLVVFKVVCENFEALHTIGNFLSGEVVNPEESEEPHGLDADDAVQRADV
ncbi:AI-2E family transporter [Roseovarius sp. Pro17]|uniref:AI-2E family transporter n=1 Tax=Roseovarius sp. Pro17 TaxID=3108175 RepID=UPI002D78488F|nr:AI-2E family transporter [Roseovarius sp. Pro17]